MASEPLPVALFADGTEFRAWMEVNHSSSAGLDLKMAKKSSSHSSIDYAQALEVALCFGWIDSRAKRIDDDWYVQRFGPRTAKSPWSKRNCDAVTALAERGMLEPSGIAEVERAKVDGRWERAYDGPRTATLPDDFLEALARNPAAAAFFETLNSQNRYAVFYRLQEAKRPETRARRIEKFVQQLAEKRKFHD
ncbi:YdeI family protein [Rhodococcus sp. NPDC058521]|uniref:YdeI/OmpD-associated family protein n=1 Tax=Rhodococcus sp. NPDC058521 TaxID=3346536 RepID=UPI003663D7EC